MKTTMQELIKWMDDNKSHCTYGTIRGKATELLQSYASHPSPMSAEQVKELGKEAKGYMLNLLPPSQFGENPECDRLWEIIHTLSTTPSVKADGWVSVEDGLPECNEKFGDSDYYSCKDENSSGTPFVAWYNNKTNVWKLAHHAVPNISVNVTHYRSL